MVNDDTHSVLTSILIRLAVTVARLLTESAILETHATEVI